jgi:nitrogen fixation protein NifU and related proteins
MKKERKELYVILKDQPLKKHNILIFQILTNNIMAYDEKVLDHYEYPRNVGKLDKNDFNVGTGLVGAPACGDVMRLQLKIEPKYEIKTENNSYLLPTTINVRIGDGIMRWGGKAETIKEILQNNYITDAKFKTFGCGSAIASSSLVTEWVKGKNIDYAKSIKNEQIVEELSLPPVKVHCSVLAEDAVKAAVKDWENKQTSDLEKKINS